MTTFVLDRTQQRMSIEYRLLNFLESSFMSIVPSIECRSNIDFLNRGARSIAPKEYFMTCCVGIEHKELVLEDTGETDDLHYTSYYGSVDEAARNDLVQEAEPASGDLERSIIVVLY